MRKNKIKKELPLLITGDLSPSRKTELEKALKRDRILGEELERVKKVIKNITDIKAQNPRPGFEKELMKSVESSVMPVSKKSSRPFRLTVALTFTAIFLFAVTTMFIINRHDKVLEAEEWLVANINSIEAINGCADISTELALNGEYSGFETELEGLLRKEFQYAESIVSETDVILGWNAVYEGLMYETYYEINESQNGVL